MVLNKVQATVNKVCVTIKTIVTTYFERCAVALHSAKSCLMIFIPVHLIVDKLSSLDPEMMNELAKFTFKKKYLEIKY